MKSGALLLLLAVAASQVDLNLSETAITGSGQVNISSCPITYYGRTYSFMDVTDMQNSFFTVCFKNDPAETSQDCLSMGDFGDTNTVKWSLQVTSEQDLFGIQDDFPHMEATPCYVQLNFQNVLPGSYANRAIVQLFNFGQQALLEFRMFDSGDVTVNATVDNSVIDSLTKTNAEALYNTFYMDLSGCRVSGVAMKADSEMLIPETCSKTVCNLTAFSSIVSSCRAEEVCYGNKTCVMVPSVCTVAASTVIDFFGRVHTIPDRCPYHLIKRDGVVVVAFFKERRRTDVPFLDHFLIHHYGLGSVVLLQGGRIWVSGDNSEIELNTTTQWVNGVGLSRDHTGVTAKMSLTNMTVFFDGTTAHVSEFDENLSGLCGNPTNSNQTTSASTERQAPPSDECAIQHSDAVDSTINCNRSTEHCNLMRQAPFTACHAHIDPKPYIDACSNTLCSYPAVDALNCRLLEAYAKACSLKGIVLLEDWRSTAGCSAVPEDFCLDQHCSDHEFCGENLGTTGCLCRALFASKYKPTNVLGDPTVCTHSSAAVTLAGCLLLEKGIDYSALHLKDPSCTGHMDDETHMISFSFNSSNNCGTEVMVNNSQVIYKNTIMVRNSTMQGIITRHDQVEIDFSCYYQMPDVRSVSFRIKDSSVVQKIVSGIWNYTLLMNAYTDPGRMQLIDPADEIQLNQKVWLELKAEELDDNMVAIVTDACWATNKPSPDSSPRYDLIINGCPNAADRTVTMEGNGQGTSNFFSFNMFEFSGPSSDIYLHCQVELCPTNGPPCAPTCSGAGRRRRRASKSKGGNPSALITMTWND